MDGTKSRSGFTLIDLMSISIADLRQNYTFHHLNETDVDPNPFKQFQLWFEQTLQAELPEPNAMTLATATKEGIPSARIVLLKGMSNRGFTFYTNYESHKGNDLAENPQAVLVFWWALLERQIRIEGCVEKVSAEEADEYFHSRPRESRLGAWVSQQSRVIPNREVLEQQFRDLDARYQEQDIPRPEHWGGYRLVPRRIEFWQGRPNRLHDRLRYRLENGAWTIERLAP
jgi:pyridoxamine 5'-phosphate oxidase